MKNIIAVIPARYASVRFKGKPLVEINGKPMVQIVYEQVQKVVQNVLVATDDSRILDKVKSFNGNVVMTSTTHANGTERCQEALLIAEKQEKKSFNVLLNVQCDEPYIQPKQIKTLLYSITKNCSFQIATLAKKIHTIQDIRNPNVVKIVKSKCGRALYFSRSVIPYLNRDKENTITKNTCFYKHIGMYAFCRSILKEIVKLPKSSLENMESLEQLRWLEHGYEIYVAETHIDSYGIDTPEDLSNKISI